jgi:hypothetical protein
MSGIRLESLASSDLVDVLHYLFEEDMFVATGEEADHKSKVRTTLYEEFYNKTYAYKTNSSGSSMSGSSYADGTLLPPLNDDFEEELEPFDASKPSKPKPYIPPTNFNPESVLPFGRDIDSPLG